MRQNGGGDQLAISIAHHTNKTAMLVDFDLRKPKIAEYLGLPDGPSLNEVLEGEADASEAFVNPGMPKLVVMPVRATDPEIRRNAGFRQGETTYRRLARALQGAHRHLRPAAVA
jgi:MinD-like ATPase involved in chromosome partitioning or flagellar assembly